MLPHSNSYNLNANDTFSGIHENNLAHSSSNRLETESFINPHIINNSINKSQLKYQYSFTDTIMLEDMATGLDFKVRASITQSLAVQLLGSLCRFVGKHQVQEESPSEG